MKEMISGFIQVLGFAILVAAFQLLINDQTGIKQSKSILKGATMYRDENGIPNIQAETIDDGFFAMGFAHAEDRLWQMYMQSKLGKGELAEIYGMGLLHFDKFMRMLNLKEICRNTFKSFTKEEKTNLQAYADGVNYYVETTKMLPLEFQVVRAQMFKWSIEDSCLSIKLVEYYLSTDFLKEIIREYILNKNVMSKEALEKIFPYDAAHFISKNTVVKRDEAKDLRKTQEQPKKAEAKKEEPKKAEAKKEEPKKAEVQKEQPKEEEIKKMNEEIQQQEKPKKYEEKPRKTVETKNPNEHVYSSKGQATVKEIPETKEIPKHSTTRKVTKSINEENPEEKMDIPHTKQDIHGGSNAYVFSGSITEDGKPILGNDPHLHNAMPSFWYVINLKIKGSFHYIGVSHPGSHCIFVGQNGYIAWGITIGFGDIADFIKVPKSKVDSNLTFKLDNKNHSLIKRTETIYLNSAKTNSVTAEFLDSEVGPILNGYEDYLHIVAGQDSIPNLLEKDYYYILRASFTNPFDSNFKALTNLHIMTKLEEVRPRLSQLSMSLAILYADMEGNIGYQLTGKIPMRAKGGEGAFPAVVEHESDFIPQYIPFEDLPHLINPSRGYIVTANNPVISSDYKHILQGGFIGDTRSRGIEKAIENHLKQKKKITTEFVIKEIIGNVDDAICHDFLSKIKIIIDKEKQPSKLLNDLKDFKCLMKGESITALKYNVFLTELYNSLYYISKDKNKDGELTKVFVDSEARENHLLYKLNQYIDNPSKCKEEYGVSCTIFIEKIYEKAISFIKEKLGTNQRNWKWANLNLKYYPHLPFEKIPFLDMLSSRLVKSNGNLYTAKTCGYTYSKKNYRSILSSNLKFVTHLNKKNDIYISIDCGNNGRLFTKNYDHRCALHDKDDLIHFNYNFSQPATIQFLPLP